MNRRGCRRGVSRKSAPDALSEHPRVGEVAVYGIAIIGGLGGLVGFSYAAESIEFFVRGYRIRYRGDSCPLLVRLLGGSGELGLVWLAI